MQSVFSEKSEFNNYLLLWNISYIFHIKIASQNVNFFNFSLFLSETTLFFLSFIAIFCQFSKHYGKLGSKGVTKYEKFYVLKDLFAIDKANDELFRLVGVAICMAIPLLIGYFSNNLLIGTFGSMGIYTFIYYQPLPLPQLLRRLNIVGFLLFWATA